MFVRSPARNLREIMKLERTIEILKDLVAFPTISSDQNRDLIGFAEGLLEETGATVEIHENSDGTKANLFATIGPDVAGGLVLSGHTDVVPVAGQDWTSDPFELRQEDMRLYGRGTCDMKGFIAACLATAPHFAALPLTRPVHFAFTYDEEVGCLGAADLMAALKARDHLPSMAIIGEPTQMRLIDGHKGCYEYAVNFKGRAGHGSEPARGVNAAEYAALYVARLLDLRQTLMDRQPDGSPFDPPYSTLSVGRIEGGVAPNVIAETCLVEWDMRPVQPSDRDLVETAMASYTDNTLIPAMQRVAPEAGITTEVLGAVEGLEPAQENEARDIVQALTNANTTDVVAFCTEAGLFQKLGLCAVVCGPGSISQAHKPDEFIEVDQLEACLSLLTRLGERLAR